MTEQEAERAAAQEESRDFPRRAVMQMAQEALDEYGPGFEVHFTFACPACGTRCTMEEANVLYERGECYACETDSPVNMAGFKLIRSPLVGRLTPRVGRA